MQTLEEIESLKLKIEKTEEEVQTIYSKQFEIRNRFFDLSVKYVLEERLLSKCKWHGVLREHTKDTGLTLIGDTAELNEATRDLLFRGHYHDSLELRPGIKLYFDDGDVTITFMDEKQVKPFLTEQNIKVDCNNFIKLKAKLEKELQIVNEVIMTVQ